MALTDEDKPVFFLLPDGTEVSNDPRYFNEKLQEQILANQENIGHATVSDDEAHRQLGTGGARSSATGADLADANRLPAPGSQPADEDLSKGVEDMTVPELKEHVEMLRSKGVEVDTTDVTKKSQLVAAIQAARA